MLAGTEEFTPLFCKTLTEPITPEIKGLVEKSIAKAPE